MQTKINDVIVTKVDDSDINPTRSMCNNVNDSVLDLNQTFEFKIRHPYWICMPDMEYVTHCLFGVLALGVFVLSTVGAGLVIIAFKR